MKLHNPHDKKILHTPVTRQNYFAGLELTPRVEECVKVVVGEALQFKNETAILLNLAREGFSDKLIYEVENETGVCLDLSSLDIEAQDFAKKYKERIKRELN